MDRFPYAALAAALPNMRPDNRTAMLMRLTPREAREMLAHVRAGGAVRIRQGGRVVLGQ